MADWLEAGLDYDEFWRRTPHEMALILQGRHAAVLAEFDRQRMVAYEQAQWIAFAVNNPAKLPPFQSRVQDELAGPSADERQRLVDDAKVRGWFISMSTRAH